MLEPQGHLLLGGKLLHTIVRNTFFWCIAENCLAQNKYAFDFAVTFEILISKTLFNHLPWRQSTAVYGHFWTFHFSFVWIFAEFSRLCNLYACVVFRTFSFPITWENRAFRKNKIESWSIKHTWTAQGCRKTKNTQESEKQVVQNNNFLGKIFTKFPICTAKDIHTQKSVFTCSLIFHFVSLEWRNCVQNLQKI